VYAVSAMPEENPTATEETTQELVPVMANECNCEHTWVKKAYSGECVKCHQKTTVSYQECSKCGAKRYIKVSCGCGI